MRRPQVSLGRARTPERSALNRAGLWAGALAAAIAGPVGCGAATKDHGRENDAGTRGLGTGGASLLGGGTGGVGGGSTGGTGGGAARGGFGGDLMLGEAGTGTACERDVSLTAVTLSEPEPFDLIIVADHSQSLAWSKDELSAGLSDLLTNVRGRSVRVILLTPTQYGQSSSMALEPLLGTPIVPWQDPATGMAYQDAMTNYSQSCTDPAGQPIDCPNPLGPDPYHVQGTWSFAMPDPVATLTPDMTDAAFSAVQTTLTNTILAIGGTGSPHEQPLCTLGRYITQDPSKLPKNAVFLVISDEDDVSVPDDCTVSYTGNVTATKNENGTTPCSSGCDAYRFSMVGNSYAKSIPFTCAAFDDLGNEIPGSEMMQDAYSGQLTSCDGITAGPCTDDEKSNVAFFCESGTVVTSCTRECSTTPNVPCSVDLHDPNVNACTSSFTANGQTYANLAAYCATRGSGWQNCSGGGVNIQYSQSLSGGGQKQSLMPGSTTADVARYFSTAVAGVFSPDAYRVEAIVFEPSFSCKLGTGQSYAANLANFVGDPSQLFPLCESYAPALSGVLEFAQTLLQTQYHLTLMADEDVTDVVVIDKSGNERHLAKSDYGYSRDTGILTIAQTALRSSDASLKVEVTSDCRAPR
jgi:hypothetical protein